MSIQALTYVLEHCEAKYGSRNLMFAIANHANERGENCWASVVTLAHEARLSRRATQYALAELVRTGEIEPTGSSPAGTTIYRIVAMAERVDQLPLLGQRTGGANTAPPRSGDAKCDAQGAQSATGGAQNATRNLSDIAPEPSGTVREPTPPNPPRGDQPVCPVPARGRRLRDNAKADAEVAAWAAEHLPGAPAAAVSNIAHRARKRGAVPTVDLIRAELERVQAAPVSEAA